MSKANPNDFRNAHDSSFKLFKGVVKTEFYHKGSSRYRQMRNDFEKVKLETYVIR